MKRQSKTNASKNSSQKRGKLQLRRETVRVLSSAELSDVGGGAYLKAQDDSLTEQDCFSSNCMSGLKVY